MYRVITYDPSRREEVQKKYALDPRLLEVPIVVVKTDVICNLPREHPIVNLFAASLRAESIYLDREEALRTNPARLIDSHVACLRATGYNDLKEWMDNPEHVYIGRSGIIFVQLGEGKKERFPKKDSIWANPYKVGRDGEIGEILPMYEDYIRKKLSSGEIPREELEKLRGKTLACWCTGPGEFTHEHDNGKWNCHGYVLLKLLKELDSNQT
jgi:hypothetical protein